MRIKKNDLLDYIILYWIIIYVFVICWLAYLKQGAFVLCVLILLRLLLDYKKSIRFVPLHMGIMISVIYPLLSYLYLGGSVEILLDNIGTIFSTSLVLIYISFICKYKRTFIIKFIRRRKLLFNGYMVLNIPILLLQLAGFTALSGRHPEALNNSFYADLVSGLFGYNGTGLLTMYFCFLFIYNLFLYQNKEIKQRKYFMIYTIVITGLIFYIAANSDNKALFILMPMFLIIYLVEMRMNVRKNILKKIRYLLKYALIAILAFTFLIIILQPVLGTGDLIRDTFTKIQNGWELSNNSYGSAERLGMIAYALNNQTIRWKGAGIGQHTWQEAYAFKFAHFGISDFGSFLCIGGITLVSLIILFMISIYKQVMHDKVSISIFLLASIVIMLYTQLFTVLSAMCSWVFFILTIVIGCDIKKIKKDSSIL